MTVKAMVTHMAVVTGSSRVTADTLTEAETTMMTTMMKEGVLDTVSYFI